MILRISETLQVPLRDRNGWFAAAGFAPVFAVRPLDDPQMGQVMAAIRLMLSNHEPYPAAVIDRAWNIRMSNAPFERLSAMIGADGTERNLMRLCFHPGGIKPFIANWDAIAGLLWQRAVREAEAAGGDDMRTVLAELAPYQHSTSLRAGEERPLLPVLPLVIAKDGVRISLFTVIATFGTAQDVTAEELRIECFFPADEETERLFRSAGAA
jgi:hypothetical protein